MVSRWWRRIWLNRGMLTGEVDSRATAFGVVWLLFLARLVWGVALWRG